MAGEGGAVGSKGGASPLVITKKRGCGFENPEPSSPKVSCIGQVRVKKKVSRKIKQDEERVHLPMSICEEALSCFCFSTTTTSERSGDDQNGFARWLVSVQNHEQEESSRRHHVFEDIEVKDDKIEFKGQIRLEEEQQGGIPPKNALLLMRCRSDPLKMAALALANLHIQQQSNEQELQIKGQKEEEVEFNILSSFQHLPQTQENTHNFVYQQVEEDYKVQLLPSDAQTQEKDEPPDEAEEILVTNNQQTKQTHNKVLPECLLLMMCEPKLSMEVSKETWVNRRISIDYIPHAPPRSSQKLTRCKSDGGG